jgi:hypothetical protein
MDYFRRADFTPDMFKYIVYEWVIERVLDNFIKEVKIEKNETNIKDILIGFKAEFVSRIHFSMPFLQIKELIISRAMMIHCLLVPIDPSAVANNDIEYLKLVNIKL